MEQQFIYKLCGLSVPVSNMDDDFVRKKMTRNDHALLKAWLQGIKIEAIRANLLARYNKGEKIENKTISKI